MTQLYQDLTAAAELLEREGWVRKFKRCPEGRCLLGALLDAAPTVDRRCAAVAAVRAEIKATGLDWYSIGKWNDYDAKDKADVLALIDRARAREVVAASNWTNFAKFARAQALVNMGGVVVYADTRGVECRVYSTALGPETALAFSQQSAPAISDLDLTPAAISGTLVFDGAYHHCVIPWSAAWAMRLATSRDLTDGLIVWPDSVPADVEPALVTALKRMGAWKQEKPQ